ncbi:hypothetical protein [Neoroseomonas rubea]|uniref:hypothetical protein n=1 Tax=Neoroseomonas rubea TaxID=2748666 RepID=UPI0018DFEADC|nr:hypothetical protein [Roseomonas rubea]
MRRRRPSNDDFLSAMQVPKGATGYLNDVGWLTPEREAAIDDARGALVEAARKLAIVSSPEHTAQTLARLAEMIREHGSDGQAVVASRRVHVDPMSPELTEPPLPEIILALCAATDWSAAKIGTHLHTAQPGRFGNSAQAIAKAVTRIRRVTPATKLMKSLEQWIGKSLDGSALRLTKDDQARFVCSCISAATLPEVARDK